MALDKRSMQTIIRRNGHLTLEGDETIDELRTALMSIRQHTYQRCAKPYLGTPIEALIPTIDVLVPASMRMRSVKNVGDKSGRL